jgi:hypothetical protein
LIDKKFQLKNDKRKSKIKVLSLVGWKSGNSGKKEKEEMKIKQTSSFQP